MDHGILVGDPLLRLAQKYIDIVEDGIEKPTTLDEFNRQIDRVLRDTSFEPFDRSTRNTDAGIAQHSHYARTCTRNFEEEAQQEWKYICRAIAHKCEHSDCENDGLCSSVNMSYKVSKA